MTRRIQCQALDGSRLGCGVSARPSHRRREAISPHQGPARAPRDLDGRRGARPERREEERERGGEDSPCSRLGTHGGNLLSNDFK